MTEEEMLAYLCIGGIAFLVIVVLSLLVLGSGPFTYRKRVEGQNTCLTVTAKRNLSRISLLAKVGDDEITFERKRIRKGQSVDFAYPVTKNPGRLTVEVEPGHSRVVEI